VGVLAGRQPGGDLVLALECVVVQSFGDAQGLLDGGERERGVPGDLCCQVERLVRGRAWRGQLVDESVLLGVGGGQRLAGKHDPDGEVGQPPRQSDQPSLGRDDAPVDFGEPEAGTLRGDDQVARQRHLKAAAERPAFDRGDPRLAHPLRGWVRRTRGRAAAESRRRRMPFGPCQH
jgi:hypothetical protein